MTKVITKAITPEFTNSEIPQSFFHGEQDIYILNEAAYRQIERVADMLAAMATYSRGSDKREEQLFNTLSFASELLENPFLGTVFNRLANLYARNTNLKKGLRQQKRTRKNPSVFCFTICDSFALFPSHHVPHHPTSSHLSHHSYIFISLGFRKPENGFQTAFIVIFVTLGCKAGNPWARHVSSRYTASGISAAGIASCPAFR